MQYIPRVDFHVPRNPEIKHLLRFAKTATVCLCFGTMCLMGGKAYAQEAKVNIDRKDARIETILNEIESQTDYLFVYKKDIDVTRLCTVDAAGKSVADILTQIFRGTGVTWKMEGKHIVLTQQAKANPQQSGNKAKHTVTGQVVDEAGEPVIGASILEEGTTNGIITDIDGNFSLTTADGSNLQISYIGYQTMTVKPEDGKALRIVLKEDSELLDEVVVVGFGTQKKVNLAGAVSVVTAEELQERPVNNLSQALQGMVPGLQISQTSGSLEESCSYKT